MANVTISNVPGSKVPVYLAGAKMIDYYPVSIVVHGVALNITVQSHVDQLCFGLIACRRAVPDVRDLRPPAALERAMATAAAKLVGRRPAAVAAPAAKPVAAKKPAVRTVARPGQAERLARRGAPATAGARVDGSPAARRARRSPRKPSRACAVGRRREPRAVAALRSAALETRKARAVGPVSYSKEDACAFARQDRGDADRVAACLHHGARNVPVDHAARPRAFGNSVEKAETTKVLAANQGLYNGFLAAGLFWGLSLGASGNPIKIFFLPA